jgi:hypothetical protein
MVLNRWSPDRSTHSRIVANISTLIRLVLRTAQPIPSAYGVDLELVEAEQHLCIGSKCSSSLKIDHE